MILQTDTLLLLETYLVDEILRGDLTSLLTLCLAISSHTPNMLSKSEEWEPEWEL